MGAKEPTSRRSQEVLKAFISEFGTHYASSAWLGATLTTETRFASMSANEEEHSERQNCIKRSFEAAMGVVANVTEISVNASVPEDLGSRPTSAQPRHLPRCHLLNPA